MGLKVVPNMKGKYKHAFWNDFIGRHYFRLRLMWSKYGTSFVIGSIIVILVIALILK